MRPSSGDRTGHQERGHGDQLRTEDDPAFPSLGAIVLGTFPFATCGMLFTVIFTPLGMLMAPLGVALLTTPKR
jgi:hypothetical protein